MNYTLALVILIAAPPTLMAASHAYAMLSQDRKANCVVLLDERVRSVENVIEHHRHKYGVTIVQTWDAATKGYRAGVPLRKVKALEADHRVRMVETWEQDDFLKP